MAQKLSHYQRLLQRMSLTPQMRQSIQLLGMSVKDLGDYIESILTQNPFLQKLIEKKPSHEYKRREEPYEYVKSVKQDTNPRSTLLSQLSMSGLSDKQLEIAEYLIYEMDDNGYIDVDPEEAAESLGVTPLDVRECLEAVQKMDPPGIGARDVKECLQIQLRRAHKEGSLEYRIVTDYVNELARNDVQKIAKALKEDEAKVRSAVQNIKRLNPRPASTIFSERAANIIPELIARVDRNKVRLALNRESLPQLKLYNPYENNLDIIKDSEAREFLKENMDAAKGLLDNLKRRKDTICKVASYILTFQRDVILNEKRALKSLTIKEVAEKLDFHPSTISRAVSNKYIQINDKVIPISSLLSHGIKKENGELTSKTAIKEKIKALVEGENTSNPLSDEAIEMKLKEADINISRRTVAKYRLTLRILPAYLRKKIKSA